MIFYFVTRYESKLSTFTSGDILGTATFPGLTDWELAVLLSWHNADPVSQEEINRNNASYTFQGNRNPYIDHPEYVNSVWGTPVADSQAPSSPSNLTLGTVTSSSIALSWTASTDNIGVSGYDVYMNSTLKTSTVGTSVTINSLTPSTTYNFYIIAKDAAGNTSTASNTISGTTSASSGGGGTTPGNELYISEYYEGLSNNKVLEITNPTSSVIALSNYSIKKQANGAGSWTNELVLSGNLNPNATLVLKNASTALSCTFTAQSANAPLDFNGNDPIGLFKSGTLIDILGTFNSTVNFAIDVDLRKKINTPSTTFNISEWDSYTITSTDPNCDNLGIVNPSSTLSTLPIKDIEFTIYPNPVKNGEIFFSGTDLKNIKFLEIYSTDGKLIKKVNQPFIKNNSIKVNELPKGIYLIKTDTNSHKVILQ